MIPETWAPSVACSAQAAHSVDARTRTFISNLLQSLTCRTFLSRGVQRTPASPSRWYAGSSHWARMLQIARMPSEERGAVASRAKQPTKRIRGEALEWATRVLAQDACSGSQWASCWRHSPSAADRPCGRRMSEPGRPPAAGNRETSSRWWATPRPALHEARRRPVRRVPLWRSHEP